MRIVHTFLCFGRTILRFNCRRSSYLSPPWNTKWSYSHDFVASVVRNEVVVKPDFICEIEENSMVEELDRSLKRQNYQPTHWDYAITNYRELEIKNWTQKNKPVVDRLKQLAVDSLDPTQLVNVPKDFDNLLLPLIHVLDLDLNGEIKPHVDSVRFCGDSIVVLSLLSSSVLRLAVAPPSEIAGVPANRDDIQNLHLPETGSWVDIFLPRRSVYVLRGASRYLFTHAILSNEMVDELKNQRPTDSLYNLDRARRISVICRTKVLSKLVPWRGFARDKSALNSA